MMKRRRLIMDLVLLSLRFFSLAFLPILPDVGLEFPFSLMLTVSSFREMHPPIMSTDFVSYT